MNRIRHSITCKITVVIVLGSLITVRHLQADVIDLTGTWRVALDNNDVGVDERWYTRTFVDPIHLPGALRDSGYGDPITSETQWMSRLHDRYWYERKAYRAYTQPGFVKVPFWLQPQRKYTGVAWYQCDVNIPASWQKRRTVVSFERAHWSTMLWLDDRQIGSNDSLATAHVYDLGQVKPGRHMLSVRVDNRYLIPIREDAHAITDSTQTNWNGLVGRLQVYTTSPVWLKEIDAFPDIRRKAVRLKIQIGNISGKAGQGTLTCREVTMPVTWQIDGGTAEMEVLLGQDAELWDEFNPALYHLTVTLKGDQADHQQELTLGLRDIKSENARFYLNGRRVFFRGTHEGCTFPLTGYPPVDVASWQHLFRAVKAYGLNHVRFHSWCPPEAAFQAADELGIYLQPECSNWGQYSSRDPRMLEFLHRETAALVKAYGNHPSFVLLSSGNEPAGPWQEPLLAWCEDWRKRDNRRLYASQSGRFFGRESGPVDHIDYLIAIRIGSHRFRGPQVWNGGDWRASLVGTNYPVISHETGQWCAFPDFRDIDKYTGALQAHNLEIFRDSLAAHGMLDQAQDFLMASGAFQLACYKEDIEALLRTPGMGGFQLLDLHDYPGQGTALVGPLNVFWQSKGYVTPQLFRRFCNATVPLARMTRRIYTHSDDLRVPLEIAHFGPTPLSQAVPYWKILNSRGQLMASGTLEARDIPIENGIELGTISTSLKTFATPGKYTLVAGLDGSDVKNDWAFWVYPDDINDHMPDTVSVTQSPTEAVASLAKGGRVLFVPAYNDLPWDCPPVERLPIFWNGLMGPKWGRSLGLLCDPNHPALSDFVTDFHYDWQWEDVIRPACRAVNIESLPSELMPIVQVIDDWNRNYKLGLIFECTVGPGKLMVCAADLISDLETRPVARQLRHSLTQYMAGDRFHPSVNITPDQFTDLLFDDRIMQKLGATARDRSPSQRSRPRNAIDGNPNTVWSVGDVRNGTTVDYPFELIISFAKPVPMTGLLSLSRQNDRNHTGDIREYAIDVSADAETWVSVVKGEWESTYDPQTVDFGRIVMAKHLKLTALSGFGNDKSAALAELTVLTPSFDMNQDASLQTFIPPDEPTATEDIEGP